MSLETDMNRITGTDNIKTLRPGRNTVSPKLPRDIIWGELMDST
jgi:hypothetical protein